MNNIFRNYKMGKELQRLINKNCNQIKLRYQLIKRKVNSKRIKNKKTI